ncbi:drug:proton antiporter [Burkholderia sp. WAC0059]|uniref:GNAT family N-acetyltransferase n=1 Tax=Burkholderia sp. WAC0059 TaxID=2066022 RepID=UPI000C7F791D|nr:GNAT family N-acetyltransferase [Burkholderia sp. WAC0059]PLZ02607.1 drug:proton antiporter [Burkholderia sp. WAC0059]
MIQSNPALSSAHLEWRWKAFETLDAVEVYEMLRARAEVFVVEQNCVYGDIDGLDPGAWHLLAYGSANGRRALAGYLRVLLPDAPEASGARDASAADVRVGRVLTTAAFRGIGLGNAMLERALGHVAQQWPGVPIRLHAQAHLQKFYGAFGFTPISDVHDEDGIAHVWMRSTF